MAPRLKEQRETAKLLTVRAQGFRGLAFNANVLARRTPSHKV